MKKSLLLLAEGFECYEASAFIDVIGWNLVDGDKSTQLFSCGLRHEIKSSFDQRILVDYLVDEIDVEAFDSLIVIGGFSEYNYYKDAYDERFLELIRLFDARKKIIASVCVGALPIARSGVLINRRATTCNLGDKKLEELRSYDVSVLNEQIVTDHNIITSCNTSAAIDVALLLLEKLTSKEQSNHIREIMGFKPM